MRKRDGIAMSLIAALAAIILALIIGLISMPSIISIALKYLRGKIKI